MPILAEFVGLEFFNCPCSAIKSEVFVFDRGEGEVFERDKAGR